MLTLNIKPAPTLPADDTGRAQWLAANGAIRDYPRIRVSVDPVAWVNAGGRIGNEGQALQTDEQIAAIAQAAYANDGRLSGAEAIAALQAKRDADQAEAQAAYDAAKIALAAAGSGLAAARTSVSTAAAALAGLPENAAEAARAAAEQGLATAQAALSAAQGQAEADYDAALAGLRAVRKHGYPPADVMDAKHAARDELAGGNVKAWEQKRANQRD